MRKTVYATVDTIIYYILCACKGKKQNTVVNVITKEVENFVGFVQIVLNDILSEIINYHFEISTDPKRICENNEIYLHEVS